MSGITAVQGELWIFMNMPWAEMWDIILNGSRDTNWALQWDGTNPDEAEGFSLLILQQR